MTSDSGLWLKGEQDFIDRSARFKHVAKVA
jgi:hypothetical protein